MASGQNRGKMLERQISSNTNHRLLVVALMTSVHFSEYQEEVDYRQQLKAEARERQGEQVRKIKRFITIEACEEQSGIFK